MDEQPIQIEEVAPLPTVYDSTLVEEQPSLDQELVVDESPEVDDDNLLPSPEMMLASQAASGQPEHQIMASGRFVDGVRTIGMQLMEEEQQLAKDLAQEAAIKGDYISVEQYAQMHKNIDTMRANDRIAEHTRLISQRAAENIVISSPATMANNSLQDLDKIAREHGLKYAAEVMRADKEKKLYGAEVGAVEHLTTLTSLVGTIYGASKLHPTIGTIAGAATSAYSLWEESVIRGAITEVTGVDVGERVGISDTLEAANKLWASVPKNKALEDISKVMDIIYKRADVLPGMVGRAFASAAASRIHTGINSETGWGLSNRTIDKLNIAAVGIDAASVASTALTRLLRAPVTAAKTTETLSGGSKVGTTVAQDLVNGTDTFKMGKGQQVDTLISSNIEQLFPEGVQGSASAGQKVLVQETRKLVDALNDEIRLNPEDISLQELRDLVHAQYSEHPNSVAKWDASTGELWIQHASTAEPFVTKNVAEAVAEQMRKNDPSGSYTVVPTNIAISKASITPVYSAKESTDALRQLWDDLQMEGVSPNVGTVLDALKGVGEYGIKNKFSTSTVSLTERTAKLLATGGIDKNTPIGFIRSAADSAEAAVRSLPKGVSADMIRIRTEELSGLGGYYSIFENKVYININFANSPSLLLHEIAHSRVAGVVDVVLSGNKKLQTLAKISPDQIRAVNNLKKLREDVIEQKGLSDYVGMVNDEVYGVKDVHEFISEALTNPIFQQELKSLKVSEETLQELDGGVKTIWDAFVRAVSKLLGVSLKDNNLLAHVLEESAVLIKSVSKEQTDMVAMLQQAGISDKTLFKLFEGRGAPSQGYYVVRGPNAALTHSQRDIDTYIPLGDPKHNASEIAMHERYITLGMEQAKKKAFSDFIDKTIAPLNKKQYENVQKILKEGDELQTEFSGPILAAKLDPLNTGRDIDKEVVAYQAFRILENIALKMKNAEAIRELEHQGWSQAVVRIAGQATPVPARLANAGEFAGMRAWNPNINGWIRIDPTTQVYRLRNSVDVGGVNTTLIVRSPGNIDIVPWLPQIPSLPGSYRRIYKQDFFGRVKTTRIVDDEVVEDFFHLRTSNSGADITAWAKGMNNLLNKHLTTPGSVTLTDVETQVGKWENSTDVLRSIQNGEWDNYARDGFSTHYNRSREDYLQSMVKGSRDYLLADRESRGMKLQSIDKWGSDNTLNPMEALGAELANVSRVTSVGAWRDRWVDTWWNTFKSQLDEKYIAGKTPLEVISDPNLNFSSYTGGEKAAKFAEKQRKYILDQIGTPTLEERWFKSKVEALTFSFSGNTAIGRGVTMAGHYMRHADPLQFARSLNFYTMLGAWNPAQLFVQTQSMVNIVAISPKQGFKAALTAPVIRIAMMSDSEAVWRKVAKAYSGSADEFVDVIKALRKSGILSGIGATSMHNIENGALNMYQGMLKKVVGTNAMFFNRAEEMVRITAFDTARREWMAANVGQAWNTNAALKNILSRTDDLTQNMTSANLAWYQRGAASIPGQFMQYQIKLAANISSSFAQKGAGRGYTRAQAARIMGAHLMMYGLAGNGLLLFYDEIAGAYKNQMGTALTDDQKLTLVEGVVAGLANEISQYTTGEDLRIGYGSRLGTFNWYENLAEGVLDIGATKIDKILGPSQTLPKKFGALRHLFAPTISGDYSLENMGSSANATLSEIFSGWNNAQKAYWAWNHDRKLVTKKGVLVANMSPAETFMQGLGIPPSEQYDFWRHQGNIQDLHAVVKKFAQDYADLELRESEALVRSNGEIDSTVEGYIKAKAAVLSGVDVGMHDVFDKEVAKIHRMRNTADGIPQLLANRLSLISSGVKLKDSPATKSYGVEEE